jgi:hypothetical protein
LEPLTADPERTLAVESTAVPWRPTADAAATGIIDGAVEPVVTWIGVVLVVAATSGVTEIIGADVAVVTAQAPPTDAGPAAAMVGDRAGITVVTEDAIGLRLDVAGVDPSGLGDLVLAIGG